MSRDVYEPSEDTDLLLDALAREDVAGHRVLEVGPGSGVVSRALLDRGARVVSVDINPLAARATADLGVPTLQGDLSSALRGRFDLVVFNAPYLPSSEEERIDSPLDHAFHGGEGGVEVSIRFVRDLPRILAPSGRALLVVSSRAELDRLEEAVAAAGLSREKVGSVRFFFEEVAVWKLNLQVGRAR